MALLLQSDLVLFIISGYLPGEYVLRIFPLISKAVQSHRLSLFLFGSTRPDILEYPLYGIYSILRDFRKILALRHSLNGLKVEGEEMVAGMRSLNRNFPNVEVLSVLMKRPVTFPFSLFPRLTKLEINYDFVGTTLPDGVWDLPLISLTMVNCWRPSIDVDLDRPPAFAQTLRSLHTKSRYLLDLLAPYCRNLQHIESDLYHELMTNNPGLTSLALITSENIDVTRFAQLMELKMKGMGKPNTSRTLVYLQLLEVDVHPGVQFLSRCPALRQASLCGSWDDLVHQISVLDPTKCKLLNLKCTSVPWFSQVNDVLLKKGFQVNEDFLLLIRDSKRHWKKIVEIAPYVTNIKSLSPSLERFLAPPSYHLPLFRELATIEIESESRMWKFSLAGVMKHCPVLKYLRVVSARSEYIDLESKSLQKLDMCWRYGDFGFNLNLPNLTHLTMKGPLVGFLQSLLDGDKCRQLPRLCVLHIEKVDTQVLIDTPLACKVGHGSLAELTISFTTRMRMVLRKLPNLRAVKINGPPPHNTQLDLDLPGTCDISFFGFTRVGCLDEKFATILTYNHAMRRWVAEEPASKRRK